MKSTQPDAPVYRLLIRDTSLDVARPRPARPTLVDSVRVAMRRGRLDSELAGGMAVHADPLRAHRARQLTTKRSRERLAAAIDKLVETSAKPRTGRSAAAPVRWSEVTAAKAALLGVADVLRSPGPVNPRGIAMVRSLLSDSSGVLYNPRHAHGDLWRAAREAMRALEDPTQM